MDTTTANLKELAEGLSRAADRIATLEEQRDYLHECLHDLVAALELARDTDLGLTPWPGRVEYAVENAFYAARDAAEDQDRVLAEERASSSVKPTPERPPERVERPRKGR